MFCAGSVSRIPLHAITMSKTGVLLVGSGAELPKPAATLARQALPGAAVAVAKSLSDALERPALGGAEVLVLGHPSPADLERAVAAVDAEALPRWAVVVLGSDPAVEHAESLAADEWTERGVARAFRSALALLTSRRELARARGDLLAIGSRVTHDLRTQVAGILATSELLKEILAEEDATRGDLLQPIFDSVDGLEKIIVRLSFLTRVSVQGAVKKRMDMGDAVFRALQRLDREIRAHSAVVTQPATWPEVAGEAPWIETIWCNLVGNALQHGRRPQIELGWSPGEGEHRFWIRDYGDGVPPEKRPQLFQPFHLLHRTNSPRGLGLPLARRLVELQGGRCGYEARPEGGSDFFFTLPTQSEVAPAASRAAAR